MKMASLTPDDIAAWIEHYIGGMCRGPDRHGSKLLKIHRMTFDREVLKFNVDPRDIIPPRVWDWTGSEQGMWTLENLKDIRVNGMVDLPNDHLVLNIYAMVDDGFWMEHAMRWS